MRIYVIFDDVNYEHEMIAAFSKEEDADLYMSNLIERDKIKKGLSGTTYNWGTRYYKEVVILDEQAKFLPANG